MRVFCARNYQDSRESYGAGSPFVENAELLLHLDGHVGHANDAPHECRPRLLGDRLQLGKVPKLPLGHLDFTDLVVEHPASQHGETASFGIGEHRVRQSLPHEMILFPKRLKPGLLKPSMGSGRPVWTADCSTKALSHAIRNFLLG